MSFLRSFQFLEVTNPWFHFALLPVVFYRCVSSAISSLKIFWPIGGWGGSLWKCLRCDFTFTHITADPTAFHITSTASPPVNIPRGPNKEHGPFSLITTQPSLTLSISLSLCQHAAFAFSFRKARIKRGKSDRREKKQNKGRKGWVLRAK